MLESLRTTRGRVATAVLTSIGVVALSFIFTDALPMLPILLPAVWISSFADRYQVTPASRRLRFVVAGSLAVTAGAGVFVFFLAQS